MINQSTVFEQFQVQGYVVVQGLLDPNEVFQPLLGEYETMLDELAAKWHSEGKLSSPYRGLPFAQRLTEIIAEGLPVLKHFDISFPPDLNEKTPIHLGPAIFGLLRNPRLLDVVECLIGPEIYSNPVQHVRIKPPEHRVPSTIRDALTASVNWHQDAGVVTTDADESNMLSVWIAVTDATVENGCLLMIPGSHQREITVHCVNQKNRGLEDAPQLTIPERFHGPNPPVPVPMRSGDVLFFHRRTMHCSSPNRSRQIRWSFDLRYNPIGQPTGREWFPGFVARSRAHPESELTDPDTWARLWLQARSNLAGRGTLAFNRWKLGDPRCA